MDSGGPITLQGKHFHEGSKEGANYRQKYSQNPKKGLTVNIMAQLGGKGKIGEKYMYATVSNNIQCLYIIGRLS